MTFRVQLTAEAECNLTEIAEWLAAQSQTGARKWLVAALNAIRSLKTSALRNGLAPESRHASHQIRQAFFKTKRGRIYRVLYYVDHETVFVTHVRGPREKPIDPKSF